MLHSYPQIDFVELCQALPVTGVFLWVERTAPSIQEGTGHQQKQEEPSCSSPRQGCPGSAQLLAYSQLPMTTLCLP